jgi:hypothetical protein
VSARAGAGNAGDALRWPASNIDPARRLAVARADVSNNDHVDSALAKQEIACRRSSSRREYRPRRNNYDPRNDFTSLTTCFFLK